MDATFTTFHRVLAFAGIPIFASKNWNSKYWLLFQTINFVIGLVCFIFTSAYVAFHSSDLLLFIQGACIWTTGVIMTISLGVCLFFRTNFRHFLREMAFEDKMLEMPLVRWVCSKNSHMPNLMKLKQMVKKSQEDLMKYTRLILRCYVASVLLCAILYLSGPIFLMVFREDENLRILAFDIWFPWSLQDFRVYVASFIFHAYCGFLCCIAYPGFQSTIMLLVGQQIRQLRILSFIVLHLNELVLEITGSQNDLWQTLCTDILSQCVEHYVMIKRFGNRLNVICRPFYLTLILVAIILVCMCSVKIAISNKLSLDTMKYYIHEFCFVSVVLMFCLLGQYLENECSTLEDNVTEKWYIFNLKHRKHVLIFKMALIQRMPIYIFGSITLSLPTFTWFIKTGMSFFTLVMSVLEEQE